MRRSSIFLLLGAILLGLLAVFAARTFVVPDKAEKGPEVQLATVVVAKDPLKFGDKIVIDNVKTIQWPGEVPADAFTSVKDAVGDGNRSALRDIKANEVLLATQLTGGASRLASSTLLGPEMRAVAVPVNEVTGAGGFVAPGDRVDVLVSRGFEGDISATAIIVQGARVLAVGQRNDPSNSTAEITKSATIEVTPAEAQQVALAQSVGTILLTLRPTGDESRLPGRVTTTDELFGPIARAKLVQASGGAPSAPSGPAQPPRPKGPEVSIVRGTAATSYQVPR